MTREEIEDRCKAFATDNGLDHEVKDYYPPVEGPDGEYLDELSPVADGITIAFETRIAGEVFEATMPITEEHMGMAGQMLPSFFASIGADVAQCRAEAAQE